MVILIGGASHTGKTNLAQKLLERHGYPYLSIDHLKMGLIRSGNTDLTPVSREEDLTEYLWGIVREMIKTAVENNQNLIVEGCYIPFTWQSDFDETYLCDIRCLWLVMSERYIKEHFPEIRAYADVIEKRVDDSDFDMESALADNRKILAQCRLYRMNYLLIDCDYAADTAFCKVHEVLNGGRD